MKSKALPRLMMLIIIFTLTVSACSVATPVVTPQAAITSALNRDPKTLVVAIYSTPTDFDPASSMDQLATIVLQAVYEGLVRVNPDNINEIKPALAESWEHNSDYTSWIFHLRRNAKFHDGTPVDATAVKSSFKRLVTIKKNMSYILGGFITDPENEIRVLDPYTIEFKFTNATPLLLKALSSGLGPYVINPKAIAEHEDGDQAHSWLTMNVAGSGPYNMIEYTPEKQVVLTRNPNWWGWNGNFHFETVMLKILPDRAARRKAIESGDTDITFNLSPTDWEILQKNPDVVVDLPPGLSISYITLGSNGYLKDPRVRRAVSYAFDYDLFIGGLWKNYAIRSYSILPGGMQCSDPDVFKYHFDLEKAKALLKESGVPMDGSVTWLYWAEEGGGDMGAGELLKSQLAKLGINLTVEEHDTTTFSDMFYSDDTSGKRPDMFRYGWWPDYNDPTDEAWVTIHSAAAGSRGGNGGFYSNLKVDALIDQAALVTDDAQLCSIYKEIQNITTEIDPPWIFLAQRPDEMILRKDIGGYQANIIYNQTLQFQNMYRIGY